MQKEGLSPINEGWLVETVMSIEPWNYPIPAVEHFPRSLGKAGFVLVHKRQFSQPETEEKDRCQSN